MTPPHNLPRQLTSFVGRAREIADIKQRLNSTYLLTLTGAGGSGKTRLALQVAADVLDLYPHGVWQVEFAPIVDPGLVPQTVAAALGVREQPGAEVIETVAGHLRSKTTLLLLDNCEHLVKACARLTDALLRGCPNLRILATSREPLGVAGELAYRVPSLEMPPKQLPSLEVLAACESTRLFVERAILTQPGFALTSRNAPAVAQICTHLDGIPLAIELAAAWTRALAVEQIAARLDDLFGLLTSRGLTILPRHQTLKAAIDWSYELLSESERALLRRLSVFAGWWTLEAAEAVCGGDGVAAPAILELLTQLVDKSLVLVDTSAEEARYRLLQTTRAYARDRLAASGEAARTARRHRDWYVALAERAEPELRGPHQIAWLERLEKDLDNLRAALESCKAEERDTEVGLRLAAALREFWDVHDQFAEGRMWLERFVTPEPGTPPTLKTKALNGAGILAHRQGDYESVAALCGEALTLSQAHGDGREAARALHFLAHAAQGKGEYARGAALLERSVAAARGAGDKHELASALTCSGDAARSEGDYDRAARLIEEALALTDELGYLRVKAVSMHNLGQARQRQGHPEQAAALFWECLTLAGELGARRVAIHGIAGLGGTLAETDPERAATLLGAAEGLLTSADARFATLDRADFDASVAVARSRLLAAAFAAAWNRGWRMTFEEAIDQARQSLESPGQASGKPNAEAIRIDVQRLSARELEVATLVAQGLTNREIASRLVIAERTAEGHVQSILNKLGFNTRSQIAAWAVERGVRAAAR
jgi:non-specific serine/threonine protein kinase